MSTLKRSRLHSPKYQEKKRKKLVGFIIIAGIFIVLIFTIFILLLNSSFLNIKNIDVSGTVGLSSETIKGKIMPELQGKYLNMIPRSSIFFYPKKEIINTLKNNFKAIGDISLKSEGLTSVVVNIKERIAAAIVCSGFRDDESESDDCYLSDNQGYIFNKAEKPYPDSYNRYYVSTTKEDISAGTSFMDESRFRSMQNFLTGTARGGLVPLGVLIGDYGQYEMYVKPDTTIYFDDRSSFDTTLSNLLAFWKNATSTQSFDYINLRFGNTVYYANKNAAK